MSLDSKESSWTNMEMKSFAPEEYFGGQIGVHRKIHTQKLICSELPD